MRSLVFTAVALFFSVSSLVAQQVAPKRFTAPLAGQVVLSEIEDKYNAVVQSMEMPEPDAAAEQKKLHELKMQMAETYPHKNTAGARKTTSSVPKPAVSIGFVADSGSGLPPDNYAAVSKNGRAISVTNSLISIHDAANGNYITRKSLKSFSTAVGLPLGDSRYDPKVVYDPEADRFICVMLDQFSSGDNWVVVGFSKSNDPTGAWSFYKFFGNFAGDTTWFDYPAIAITHDEFFITGNKIMDDSSWQAGFTRTVIYQVRKADGYNGAATLHYQIWDSVQYNNRYIRCLHPVNPSDGLLGPAQYFLSDRNFDATNDSIFLVKVPDTIGSTNNELTVTALVSPLQYHVPPDGRQPDTAHVLATNDGRILGGYMRGDEIQFVSTSLNPANGASAVYHGVISNVSKTPSITAQMISVDAMDFGYPNISFAGSTAGINNSIISFDYTGPNTQPGFGAVFFDGTNYSDLTVIKAGDSSIHYAGYPVREQRWGDYSGSQPDWAASRAVWVEGIFGKKNYQYGNYMARLISPFEVSVPTEDINKIQARVYPNPAEQFVSIEFNVVSKQVFTFYIYDAAGRLVDKMLENSCDEGKNVLTFNIAPLAPGSYLLKAIGSKGEQLPTQTVIRK